MSTPTETDQKPRRWLAPAITAALIVAGVGGGIAFLIPMLSEPTASQDDIVIEEGDTGDDEDISEDPLTTIIAPTARPLSADEQAEAERASVAVDAVVAATDEISQRGDGSAVGIEAVATGWVLGELQSKAREQYDLGYRQTGEAAVTSVTTTTIDLASTPATITLKVCIDVAGIDVTDAAGNSLKASLYNPGHPVAHLYGAVFEGDTWKISTHDIPDVQDCPAA